MQNKIFKYNFGTEERPKEVSFSFRISQLQVFEQLSGKPVIEYVSKKLARDNVIHETSAEDVVNLVKALALESKYLEKRSDQEINYLLDNCSLLEFAVDIHKALVESCLGIDKKDSDSKKKVQQES